ncbi:hypothetical protein EV426DRAFT_705927 [Tirmania nivea]|nr:hypothetical protein EV426DRAFT_705927 [Tirmania nivea]
MDQGAGGASTSDIESRLETSRSINCTCVVGGIPFPAAKLSINRLQNLLTLSGDAQKLFGKSMIILEPIGDPLSIFGSPTITTIHADSANVNPTTPAPAATTPPLLTSYDILFSYLPSRPTTSSPPLQNGT